MSLWSSGASQPEALGRPLARTERESGANQPLRLVRSVGITRFTDIACGAAHCLAVTAEGALYSWGLNAQGQLGDGTTEERARPAAVPLFTGRDIGAIAYGGAHSAALVARSGSAVQCFTWGLADSGQLGHDADQGLARGSPRPVTALDALPEASLALLGPGRRGSRTGPLACGASHTALLTATGALLTWGSNHYGQCGLHRIGRTVVPAVVHSACADRFAMAACGAAHTLLLDEQGRVYACGLNATG